MVGKLEKSEIINLKRRGKSNREVARITGFDRETVSRYWSECQRLEAELKLAGSDKHEIQEALCQTPKYKVGSRDKRVYTEEVDKWQYSARLQAIFDGYTCIRTRKKKYFWTAMFGFSR